MKNILLVDDENINRLFISTKIKKAFQIPYNLLQVTNWYDAIAAAQKQTFDYVIMDYWMPWINWWDTMQRLVKDMGWKWMWIGYTAFNVDEYWKHFLDAWAKKVFLKHDEIDNMLDFIINTDIESLPI